jgi:hypothetical protein
LLHDEEILQIRGINTDYYDLPRKVLSDFAHFSSFSVPMMKSTSRDWHRIWSEFLLPAYHVVRFVSEGLAGFAEIFPVIESIVSDSDRHLIESYRSDLHRRSVKKLANQTELEQKIARRLKNSTNHSHDGAPDSGKSMIAECLPTILAPITLAVAIGSTKFKAFGLRVRGSNIS